MKFFFVAGRCMCRVERELGVQAFLKKVKAQLSEEQLDEFRREASSFLQGVTDGPSYHRLVVSLGLGAMVPEMAALLPDEDRRAELLSAHSAAQQFDLAADAAAAHAMQFGSWQCNRRGLCLLSVVCWVTRQGFFVFLLVQNLI